MGTVPLDVSITAQAGPDGIARGEIGPTIYGHTWEVRRIATTTNDFVNRNECRVYLNAENSGRMVGGSYNGNQDFNEDDIKLQSLDKLKAVWSMCAPGTQCVLQLQGLIHDRRL